MALLYAATPFKRVFKTASFNESLDFVIILFAILSSTHKVLSLIPSTGKNPTVYLFIPLFFYILVYACVISCESEYRGLKFSKDRIVWSLAAQQKAQVNPVVITKAPH